MKPAPLNVDLILRWPPKAALEECRPTRHGLSLRGSTLRAEHLRVRR